MFSHIKNRFFSLYNQSIFIIVSPSSQSLSLSPPSRSTPSLSLISKEQASKSQQFDNFIPQYCILNHFSSSFFPLPLLWCPPQAHSNSLFFLIIFTYLEIKVFRNPACWVPLVVLLCVCV